MIFLSKIILTLLYETQFLLILFKGLTDLFEHTVFKIINEMYLQLSEQAI